MNCYTGPTTAEQLATFSSYGNTPHVACVVPKETNLNEKTIKDLEQDIGTKDDIGKPNLCLLDTAFIEEMAMIMQYGLDKKYKRDNWKQPMNSERLLAAAYRHANDIQQGEEFDPESHLSHAAHIAVNAMMYAYQTRTYGGDTSDSGKSLHSCL